MMHRQLKSMIRWGVLWVVMLSFVPCTFATEGVTWSSEVRHEEGDCYEVIFSARIQPPWHMYDMGPYEEFGPNATSFRFESTANLILEGDPRSLISPVRMYSEIFGMGISYYTDSARFSQRVKLTGPSARLGGTVSYQLCDDKSCLPPEEWEFMVPIGENAEGVSSSESDMSSPSYSGNEETLWRMIVEAILWGFAALLTPCVFPMVPMTVSFFMKRSGSRAKGRFRAFMYGVFIVLLYTLPIGVIIIVTRLAGGDAVTADIFNWLATHWLPNLIFFIVFMIFAASFLGAFEIVLPSRLVNSSDRKADREGLAGVFFMALTLVLVSFSCTGPIVGTVLIKSTAGEFWAPILTMFAFSVAFALPFTLCALFPTLLEKLPKSGGWLNSVKVTLGFIELALGLKFLSVADQTYHWGILDREIYLALWIVIFSMLGMYLLGKLQFRHDSPMKHVSVTRLLLAIVTFAFVVYMIPGMWGAPLKGLSGYLPPLHTQDFVLDGTGANGTVLSGSAVPTNESRKYADFLSLPHGLDGYFDFDQALSQARKEKKPLLVDFTGHGCVNCREMEMRVWSDPAVLELLRNDYVIVALYSDDKKILPESDWVTLPDGKILRSLGKINSRFARERFGVNAQPSYIIVGSDGEPLLPVRGYDLDVNAFVAFLETGIAAYRTRVE